MDNSNVPIYVWQPSDVCKLIKVRVSLNELFTGRRGSSNSGWEAVAANLRCGANALQCKKKWENLQTKYKKIMDPPTGEGLEERSHGAHDWPYFDAMNRFMSNRHVMKPLLLIQSSTIDKEASQDTNSGQRTPVKPSSLSSVYSSESSPSCSYQPARPSSSCSSEISTSFSPHSPSPPGPMPRLSATLNEAQHRMNGNYAAPARKRRRDASRNADAICDLVTMISEDLRKQDREREQARQVEQDLLELLREFLSKK